MHRFAPFRAVRAARVLVAAWLGGFALAAHAAGSWDLVAGDTAPFTVVVACVPAAQLRSAAPQPGRLLLGADAVGRCVGQAILRYEAIEGLSVTWADIDGYPCTTTTWYESCMYGMGVYQRQVITTRLSAGPFVRAQSSVYASGVDVPAQWPLNVTARGSLSVSQDTPLIVPGVDNSGSALLKIGNAGPSGARDVRVTEVIPPYISVKPESDACTFSSNEMLLRCAWATLDPGATISVPLRFSAELGVPTSQLNTRVEAQSDIGGVTEGAILMVSGNAIVVTQSPSPAGQVTMGSVIRDSVSVHTLPKLVPGGVLPPPGIPVVWSLTLSPGLQVESVTPEATSGALRCTYSDASVRCAAPNYGSGQPDTDADAAVKLRVTGVGRLTIDLHWSSDEGNGDTRVQVRSLWNDASETPPE